jgi:hypothetical protein
MKEDFALKKGYLHLESLNAIRQDLLGRITPVSMYIQEEWKHAVDDFMKQPCTYVPPQEPVVKPVVATTEVPKPVVAQPPSCS